MEQFDIPAEEIMPGDWIVVDDRQRQVDDTDQDTVMHPVTGYGLAQIVYLRPGGSGLTGRVYFAPSELVAVERGGEGELPSPLPPRVVQVTPARVAAPDGEPF